MIPLAQLAERSARFAALPEEQQRELRDQLYLLAHTVVGECVQRHTAAKKAKKDQVIESH